MLFLILFKAKSYTNWYTLKHRAQFNSEIIKYVVTFYVDCNLNLLFVMFAKTNSEIKIYSPYTDGTNTNECLGFILITKITLAQTFLGRNFNWYDVSDLDNFESIHLLLG